MTRVYRRESAHQYECHHDARVRYIQVLKDECYDRGRYTIFWRKNLSLGDGGALTHILTKNCGMCFYFRNLPILAYLGHGFGHMRFCIFGFLKISFWTRYRAPQVNNLAGPKTKTRPSTVLLVLLVLLVPSVCSTDTLSAQAAAVAS